MLTRGMNSEQRKEYNYCYLKDINWIDYYNCPSDLSLAEIRYMEEPYNPRNLNIYNDFIETISGYDSAVESECIDQVDRFVQKFKTNSTFKASKLNQLENTPNELSQLELFALARILKVVKYDDFNPIVFGNFEEVYTTTLNLLIGKLIEKIIKLPEMSFIYARLKISYKSEMDPTYVLYGQIANFDKPTIIQKIVTDYSYELNEIVNVAKQIAPSIFLRVLEGREMYSFLDLKMYNTNISFAEVDEWKKTHKNYTAQLTKKLNDK